MSEVADAASVVLLEIEWIGNQGLLLVRKLTAGRLGVAGATLAGFRLRPYCHYFVPEGPTGTYSATCDRFLLVLQNAPDSEALCQGDVVELRPGFGTRRRD